MRRVQWGFVVKSNGRTIAHAVKYQ